MKKGRSRDTGEFIGLWVETTLLLVPEDERPGWKERFFRELGDVCLKTRKKGEPPLIDVNELEGYDVNEVDLVAEPEALARLVKELSHFAYNAYTKKRILTAVHDFHGVKPNFVRDIAKIESE